MVMVMVCCYVYSGADEGVALGHGVGELGDDAEIRQLHNAFVIDQRITGLCTHAHTYTHMTECTYMIVDVCMCYLNISMHFMFSVHGLQSVQQLFDDVGEHELVHRAEVLQRRLQRTAVHVLQCETDCTVVVKRTYTNTDADTVMR